MPDLSSLLDYVVKNVPRYQGLAPRLASFPVLGKPAILADLASHLSDELGSEHAGLLELLASSRPLLSGTPEYLHKGKFYIEETSGSSGLPFRLVKTAEERARLVFGIWQCRRQYDSFFTAARFYPFDHAPLNFLPIADPNDARRENVDRLYINLSAMGIRWVHGRARMLRLHAEAISDPVAKNMSVRVAENTGYTLTAEDRQFISAKLNVAMVDQYGCREVLALGYRVDDEPFTVLSANVLVEIVDADGTPIEEPGVEGRIVVTSLHQRIFPIIRFSLGDLGQWDHGSVGRRLHLATYRPHNGLRFGGATVNGNEFFKAALNTIHRHLGPTGLAYLQIRQTAPGAFTLAVSKSPRAVELWKALAGYWETRFPEKTSFQLLELEGDDLRHAMAEKPSLFTTKYMLVPA